MSASSHHPLPPLGLHIPYTFSLLDAIDAAQRLDCCALQVYTRHPEQVSSPRIPSRTIRQFVAHPYRAHLRLLIVHAPLLINLAATDDSYWNTSQWLLRQTLYAARNIHAQMVVVHPGNWRGSDETTAIKRVAHALTQVFTSAHMMPRPRFQLLLENSAKKKGVGTTFASLKCLLDALPPQIRAHTGICLDSAHAWAAGYQCATPHTMRQVLLDFEHHLGTSTLKLIHANNASDPCGSFHDRHARWDQPEDGPLSRSILACFQHDPRFRHVPILLETPLRHQGANIDWHQEQLHLDLIKRTLRT